MSTVRTSARKALTAALAGVALTAGLGLGGAGVADAAPPQPHLTCITNVAATTKLTVDYKLPLEHHTYKPGHVLCLAPGQSDWIAIGADHAAGIWGTSNLKITVTANGVQADLLNMEYSGSGLPNFHTKSTFVPDSGTRRGSLVSVAEDQKGNSMYSYTAFLTETLS